MTVTFTRTATFSAAHRYAIDGASVEENKRVFGSLYRDEGFGHNFLVEAHFTGPVDQQTGMIVNLVDVDRWLKATTARFDHKFLNELPEFAGTAPSLEMIARRLFEGVRALMAADVDPTSGVRLNQIRLTEGTETWADYFG